MTIHFTKNLLGAVLLLLAHTTVLGQTTVSGSVIDSDTREPLQGVSVTDKYATKGMVTRQDGQFELTDMMPDDTVRLTYIGYQTQYYKASEVPRLVTLASKPTEIKQAVVTASRHLQDRTEQPVAIQTLGVAELEEAHPTSLYQVLNKATGVNMIDLGNDQHSLSIRQPNSTRAVYLYLENGVPIRPNGVFNHNALIEINQFSLRNIEIVRGPSSSVYGSEAIGGAINFITHKPTLDPVLRVAAQGDNLGYRNLEFRTSNSYKGTGVLVSGSYAGRRNGFRAYSDYDKYAGTVSTRTRLNNSTYLTNNISLVNYRTDATVSIDSASFFRKEFGSVHNFAYRIVKALRVNSKLDKLWDEDNHSELTVFHRNNFIGQNATHTIKNDQNNPLGGSSNISNLGFYSFGAIAQHRTKIQVLNTTLIAGVSTDYSPVDVETRFITITRAENGDYLTYNDPDSLLTRSQVNILNTAAYAQAETKLGRKFNLVTGLRLDNYVYDHDNYLDQQAFSGAPDSKSTFRSVTPKAGLTYNPTSTTGFYTTFSKGFVPPQVSELYRGVKVPVLGPMEFYNSEVGGWYNFSENGYLEVSVYSMRGRNEIISVLLDDGTTENQNAGRTSHKGIEYAVHFKPVEEVFLRFSGTNARHEFEEYPERGKNYDGNQMPGAPNWIASAEVRYNPTRIKGFSTALEWNRIGSYYMDQANTEKYSGYHLLQARVGYDFGRFNTWFNVYNVTDELIAVNASKNGNNKRYSIGEPRSFRLGMALDIGGK